MPNFLFVRSYSFFLIFFSVGEPGGSFRALRCLSLNPPLSILPLFSLYLGQGKREPDLFATLLIQAVIQFGSALYPEKRFPKLGNLLRFKIPIFVFLDLGLIIVFNQVPVFIGANVFYL